MKYELNFESNIPIYQQLADMICADIKSGKLPIGTKLPTVRDFSEELGIAKGTVKRTYEELRQSGMVDMTQGRGTFVQYQKKNSKSRKERAMAAIDQMLTTLKGLDISATEMQIFVELRLREYLKNGDKVKAGFVECSPEILAQISDRLRDFEDMEVFPYLLDDVINYPYKIGEDMDIVITTGTHAEKLEEVLTSDKKLFRVGLAMRSQSIKNIAQLPKNAKVGIACKSERFAMLITEMCIKYSECENMAEPFYFGEGKFSDYLEGKDALLVPANFENFCTIKESEQISKFTARHIVIKCSYQAVQGSILGIEERIKLVKEKNKL